MRCRCAPCRAGLKPFTKKHFAAWCKELSLDNGEPWVVEKWQLDFVGDLFSGVRECWLVVPEGNGKTTLIAGLALYEVEHVSMAEVPIAAAAIMQANTLFNQAQGMIVRNPHMYLPAPDALAMATGKRKLVCPRFEAQRGFKRIRHHTGGYLEVRSSDENTTDGIIPGGIAICEELHRHKTLDLYKTWKGKLKKRRAQIVVISTAGEPGGEFEKMRSAFRVSGTVTRKGYCTRAINGKLSVIHDWAMPEKSNVLNLKQVAKANPSSYITEETLADDRDSPSFDLAHWRRFTCNIPTRSEDAAITDHEWTEAEVSDEIPEGEAIMLGMDVGWKYDTTALVPLWWRDEHYRLLGKSTVIAPPRNGLSTHPDVIKSAILKIHARNPIDTIVMDISAANDIAAWLDDELSATLVVERGQSNSFACADYENFMEALRNGWLLHVDDPDLTKHAMNAIARPATYGDLRFDRPAHQRSAGKLQESRVIDALIAAAMVHSVALEALDSGVSFGLV